MAVIVEHPLAQRFRITALRFQKFVAIHERTLLWTGIVVFIVTFTGLAAWKLSVFAYNAIDLAIYNQVAANSIRGDLFGLTIHPHSYLGDHLELFFAVLWPFYALWQSPLTLIFLQNVALALAAWPLAKIAARILGKPWHLMIALAYLMNPIVQNIALYEFHLLPFAIPIVSFAILAYIDQRYRSFVLLSLLAMTVREDVALVIIGFGFLAAVDRRPWRWSVVPILLGTVWLIGALKISSFFSGYEQYKYLIYYGWLGDGPWTILQTMVTKPWVVLNHLLHWSSLGLAVALLLPFAFLPVLRRRWLLPAIPIIAQIFLVQNPDYVVTLTHYPALLLPFLLVAATTALHAIRRRQPGRLVRFFGKEWGMVSVVYVAIAIYTSVSIGPLLKSVTVVAATKKDNERIRLERSLIDSLSPGGAVAGLETLTALSARPRLYSWHYVFLGHKQFSDEPYTLPDDAAVGILDQKDFLLFQLLYTQPSDADGYTRVRNTLTSGGFVLTSALDRFIAVERRNGALTDLATLFSETMPANIRGPSSQHRELEYLGWSSITGSLEADAITFRDQEFRILPFDLTFKKNSRVQKPYQLEFTFVRDDRTLYQTLMPFGAGLYPITDWPVGSPVTTTFRLLLPPWLHGATDVRVRVLDLEGHNALNGVRSASPNYTKYQGIGPVIPLGHVDL